MSLIPRVIPCTVASGASFGNADLGGVYNKVYLENVAPGAAVALYAARALGGTYRQVLYPSSGVVQGGAVSITSAASGQILQVPLEGLQYVQVAVTATAANGTTFYLICS